MKKRLYYYMRQQSFKNYSVSARGARTLTFTSFKTTAGERMARPASASAAPSALSRKSFKVSGSPGGVLLNSRGQPSVWTSSTTLRSSPRAEYPNSGARGRAYSKGAAPRGPPTQEIQHSTASSADATATRSAQKAQECEGGGSMNAAGASGLSTDLGV